MKIETYIDSLVSYAMNTGLADPLDHQVLTNRLLDILRKDDYEPSNEPQSEDLEEILAGILDCAVANGLCDDGITAKDIFDTRLMCNKGHEWKQMIYERANGSKCPYCNQRKAISGENDVGTLFPTICKEWHPHRNMERIPALFLPNSREIVWWQCEQGHEWERSIHDRVNGSTCPYCDKKLPVIGESDIGTLYPNLRKRWDG